MAAAPARPAGHLAGACHGQVQALYRAVLRKTIDPVQRSDVQEAVGTWAESLAPSTVKVTYGYLSAMFRVVLLDGFSPKSPCVGLKLPALDDVTVVPLRTEVVQLLAERIYSPFRPLMVFCAATGLRWLRCAAAHGTARADARL